MSFCAASCCTRCPGASSASATSASSPTAGVPLSYRFAIDYSTQNNPRNPNQKRGQPSRRIHFGAVPNVAAPWWSSKDLLRPSSNFVLRPGSLESRHDTPIPISLAGVSPHLQASCAFVAHSPSFWLRAFARKLQSNQARWRSGSLPHRFPESFSSRQHHRNCIDASSPARLPSNSCIGRAPHAP